MHRVKRAGNYANIPDPPAGGTPGYFGPGDLGTNTPATIPGYDWFNAVQEEIIAPILAAGLTPDEDDRGQLLAALNAGWDLGKSHGANGYQGLPGGLIIQWGVKVTTSGEGAVTFPLAFPTAVYSVVATDITNGAYTSAEIAAVGSVTTSGFNVSSRQHDGTSVNTTVYWISVGR